MNTGMLEKIQKDIQNNFGNAVNWDSIPPGNFNCYMYALFNTVSTEVFCGKRNGGISLRSLINENISYFGDIGQISGKTHYTSVAELIEAMKSDFETLGISIERCSLETVIPKKYVKIAFCYDTKGLAEGKHLGFHFLRQENNIWMHKNGWIGGVEQLESPIKYSESTGLELIGYFKICLKRDSLS